MSTKIPRVTSMLIYGYLRRTIRGDSKGTAVSAERSAPFPCRQLYGTSIAVSRTVSMRRSINLRLDNVTTLDPLRPHESSSIGNLVDVSALHDDALCQISSSYEAIVRERLKARFCTETRVSRPFAVTFEPEAWGRYVAHRRAEPERFPPAPVGVPPSYGNAGPNEPEPPSRTPLTSASYP